MVDRAARRAERLRERRVVEAEAPAPSTNPVRPKLSLMSEDQMRVIHDGAVRILKEVGLRVDSPRAREVYAKGGASIRIDDKWVFMDRDVIEWAIKVSPPTYNVYNRRGEHKFTLGVDQPTRFGSGVTNLYFQDPMDDHL